MWSVLNSCGFKVTQYLLDLVLDGTGMVTLPSWGAWAFSCRTCITGERKKKKSKLKTHTLNREITCHRPNDRISLRESERKRENRLKSNQAKIESNYIDEPTDWTNEHSQDRSQKKDQAEATKERANKIARWRGLWSCMVTKEKEIQVKNWQYLRKSRR